MPTAVDLQPWACIEAWTNLKGGMTWVHLKKHTVYFCAHLFCLMHGGYISHKRYYQQVDFGRLLPTHKRISTLPNGAHLKGFLEKILSYVGRFALILNALHENGDVVPEIIMHAAIDLANYFILHVEKATKKLSSSKAQQETTGVLEWAKRKGFDEINVRLLVRAGLPGCANVEGAKEKLQELVDLEHASWVKYNKEVRINGKL